VTLEQEKIRILGIDPGYGRVGWGVIEGRGNTWKHVAHGCIDTNPKRSHIERYMDIARALKRIIEQFSPTRGAVEQLFFAKNVKTALSVAEARGVILLTLSLAGLDIDEFTPLQVKQSLTGYGKAEKGQVQRLVQMQLGLSVLPKQDDAADALAVALTAGFSAWQISFKRDR